MADASQAEFSRNRNPLYLPDHTPVKLPTHILDGNLDIKIPEYSTDTTTTSTRLEGEKTGPRSSQNLGPIPSSGGTGMRPHQNGISEEPRSEEMQEIEMGDDSTACDMENQERDMEQWNDTRHSPVADTRKHISQGAFNHT